MKNIMKTTALFIAACMIWLSGFALPFDNRGNVQGIPEIPDHPITVDANTYTYSYVLSMLDNLPATKVIPQEHAAGSWSVADGIVGNAAALLKSKWDSDEVTMYKNPATPAVCLDMSPHYFIAQFYRAAPGQYGAMVLGQDGYFHNVYSFFCEILSSAKYTCWGLPIDDTKKHSEDNVNYYSIDVQTDPCYGSTKETLYFFPDGVPTSLESEFSEIGICTEGIVVQRNDHSK
jgi:hypothetical protein